jgi:Ala-tRNA(Pro) deacylase
MNIKTYLQELGINFKIFKHPPVFTCEQARKHRIYENIRGIHSKNLFLKNRKSKKFYLVVLPEDKPMDLDELGKKFNEKLKFANEENLKEFLGLTPGSVSPFGLINDKQGKILVVIDDKIWNSDFVSFHPNINSETLELSGKDFQKYIKSLKNDFLII